MQKIAIVALLLALAACASSSGAYMVGPGTYRITSTAITSMGGEGAAKGHAVKEASAYCAAKGKQALVTDDKSDAQFTQGSATVTFRCVEG